MEEWIIGVLMTIVGSLMINLGQNLMKYSHDDATSGLREKLWGHDKVWVGGVVLMVVGSLINFASYSFAAQVLLVLLGSVQFVSNVALGHWLLGEVVTRSTLVGTVSIVVGNCGAVWAVSVTMPDYSVADMVSLYGRTWYVLYLVGTLGAFAAGMWYLRSHQAHPHLYAVTSALLGTQAVLNAKCLSEMLRQVFEGDFEPLRHPFFFGVLVFWGFCAWFWVYRMNSALRQFDGLVIIPVFQVCWMLFSTLGGGIYWREFEYLSEAQLFVFFVSGAVICYGAYTLSPSAAEANKQAFGDIGELAQEVEVQAKSHTLLISLQVVIAGYMVLSSKALEETRPTAFLLFTVLLGTTIMASAAVRSDGPRALRHSPEHSWRFVAAGACHFLHFFSFITALAILPVFIVAGVSQTSPVLLLLWRRRHQLNVRQVAGYTVVALGATFVMVFQYDDDFAATTTAHAFASVLMVVSAVCQAAIHELQAPLLEAFPRNSVLAAYLSVSTALAFLLAVFSTAVYGTDALMVSDALSWAGVLYGGVLGIVYVSLLNTWLTEQPCLYWVLQPFVVAVLAFYVLDAGVGWLQSFGCLLVLCGILAVDVPVEEGEAGTSTEKQPLAAAGAGLTAAENPGGDEGGDEYSL